MKQEIPIKRFAVEAFVIAGSILLAFAIDAWWVNRTEQIEEVQILRALKDELESNNQIIATQKITVTNIADAIKALMSVVANPDVAIGADTFDRMIGDISWWTNSIPFELATLDALTQGGKMSLVRNDELMRNIAIWQRSTVRLQIVANQDYDYFFGVFMPFMREYSYLPQINNTKDTLPNGELNYTGKVPVLLSQTDHRELMNNLEFQNLLLQKYWVYSDILNVYSIIEPRLDYLIGLIEQEIDM